jgi:hypothetical protein
MFKKFLISLCMIMLWSTVVYAAAPVIFYSDLTSGPKTGGQNNKGVFVTINGNNFGTSRGSSYVTVGSGQTDNYPVWTDTKISFQLGANAASGNIAVTTSEGTSNGMPFTVRSGNIYFVSVTGNNGSAGSYDAPWRTWQYATDHIAAGDTVYGRGGNYTTATDLGAFSRCFSVGAYAGNSGGANGNPKAFVAYPGETPILYPVGVYNAIVQIYDGSDVTIAGLSLYDPAGSSTECSSVATAWNSNGNTTNISNIRIVGNIAKKNFLSSGNAMSGAMTICNGTNIYIAGNKVSDVGNGKQEHGIYLNEALTNVVVEYNEVSGVHNGYGIEIYNDYAQPYTNCVVRNNTVYQCGRSGLQLGAPGTYQVYNNIVWDCGQISFAGINLRNANATTTYELYNNTLYDNGQNELSDGNDNALDEPYGHVWKDSSVIQSLTFRNNVINSVNSSEPYWRRDYAGGSQAFSNNLYYGNGGKPSFDNGTTSLNADPLFMGAPGHDFHLQAASPCTDTGANTTSVVQTDEDGLLRPQGAGVDIGAYEYAAGYTGGGGGGDVTPPAAITDLAVSNQTATSVTLTWTAPGNDGNIGAATSYDIRYSLVLINDSNFTSATQVSGVPTPQIAGTTQSLLISGLQTGFTYYFAMKTRDAIPNTSLISNIISATPNDIIPPVAVSNLKATTGTSDGQIVVTWTAPGDDGSVGQATLYDLRYSTANITLTNWPTATKILSLPTPKIAGSAESVTVSGLVPGTLYYFGLKASDELNNISTLSNISSANAYNTGITDTISPSAISNLTSATGAHNGEIVLNWTATGDDGNIGTANAYDIRYSRYSININSWQSLAKCANVPAPKVSGSREKFVVTGLSRGKNYYLAMKAIDDAGLASGSSNLVSSIAYDSSKDTVSPGAITDMAVTNTVGNEVTLSWTAPGGDGQTGTCSSYDIRYATYPINSANFSYSINLKTSQAIQAVVIPVPNSAGIPETTSLTGLLNNTKYYFAIKSYDGAGHVSALSNIPSITLAGDSTPPALVADLAAAPGTDIGSIIIGWTAPGNDGQVGQASIYTIKYATFTIDNTNWNTATLFNSAPTPDIAGTYQAVNIAGLVPGSEYFFALKTADLTGNISGISNIAQAIAKEDTPPPPDSITDLTAVPGNTDGEVILKWTAPSVAGQSVSGYEIRYSKNRIYEVNISQVFSGNEISWANAPQYPSQALPAAPGQPQTFTIAGLEPNQIYYFAVKSYNAGGSLSVISNICQSIATNTDHTPPQITEDLHTETGSNDGEVILTWTAPGDNGNIGTAASYDIRYSLAPINELNWAQASQCANIPVPKIAGSKESFTVGGLVSKETYYFALKAIDTVGNTSGISNSPSMVVERGTDLSEVRTYPNPWTKDSGFAAIYITHLTEKAKVRIFTINGELVKTLTEDAGIATWDMTNEDGNEVASGVYVYLATDDAGHKKTGKIVIIK